ncbi:hypothetical protein O9992_00265 [Vibrio lentus]|nr:hypothetical protein [Vibrio lentus]
MLGYFQGTLVLTLIVIIIGIARVCFSSNTFSVDPLAGIEGKIAVSIFRLTERISNIGANASRGMFSIFSFDQTILTIWRIFTRKFL